MAIDIGELRGIITLQDRFSGPANNVGRQLGVMGDSFRAVTRAAGIVGGVVTGATAAIVALGIRGGEIATVRDSFGSLARAVGETGDAILDVTREKTKGLITDFDLMAAGNKAMLLGLPVTASSLGTMAEAALVLGRAMKLDATKSLDDFTTALGRGSPLILDNLGLTVRVGEANEAYARQLKKPVAELTEAEKKTAFYSAAMEAAKAKVEELGGVQINFADRVRMARVALGNFVDGLSAGIATSPVLAAGMDTLTEAISAAFGGRQQNAIDATLKLVEGFAIGLVQAGEVGVWVARQMSNAWNGLQVIFNAAMAVLLEGLGAVVNGVALVLEAHAAIPGLGLLYEGAAETVRALGTDLDFLATGFVQQAADAVVAAGATNAAYDQVQEALGRTKAAMRAAATAGDEMGASAMSAAGAARDLGAATAEASALAERMAKENAQAWADYARAQADAATQIADRTRSLQQELALANTQGLQQRLLEIQFEREAELLEIEALKVGYQAQYQELAALVNAKYDEMTGAARAAAADIVLSANEQGFRTRAQLEETAAKAEETYQRMLASGQFTIDTLKEAWVAAEQAKRDASEETKEFQLTSSQAIVDGALQIFGVLGQRFKAAAIAGAIISTYQAIAKALASAPWPANLVLAAGAAAAGFANVQRIRSSEAGFRRGTPRTSFMDFGAGSLEMLHGPEAVVTLAQGQTLAGMIGDEVRAARREGGADTSELAALREELRADRQRMPWLMTKVMRDALQQSGMQR